MRNLSASLLAAQQQATRQPCVRLVASNRRYGVTRLMWERLYSGSEADYYHGVAAPSDGGLVRVRIGPPSDARKLYRQRVSSPAPGADFSQWTYTGEYNSVAVAAASLGSEVSIFWLKTDRRLQRLKSSDGGATWGSPELVDYSPTTAMGGISAAYKPNGDLALFWADQQTLYVKKLVAGQWQARAAWDKTTGLLTGVAALYGGDWQLLLTGQNSAGDYRLWSLIYGDGGEVGAGTWSALTELAAAPLSSGYDYRNAFMARPDVACASYVEHCSAAPPVSRPCFTQSLAGTTYAPGTWCEPELFDYGGNYGLALAWHGDYCWLSSPSGVWRASLAVQETDLSPGILNLRVEDGPETGSLTAELDNSRGDYDPAALAGLVGCEVSFSPGYVTSQGVEVSDGPVYSLISCGREAGKGKKTLHLTAGGGWERLAAWTAWHQFRWNHSGNDLCVREIVAFILARVGLRLVVMSQSAMVSGYFPDFTISPGDSGISVIRRLLSFVPDALFFEGNIAYLVNPQPGDAPVYTYDDNHPVLEGSYSQAAQEYNHVRVEGRDPATGAAIIADCYNWDELEQHGERLLRLEDRNLTTLAAVQARGLAILRKAEMSAVGGHISVAVNPVQQLYDVVAITEPEASLEAVPCRIVGITTTYRPGAGRYEQRLLLGAV